MKLLDAIKEVSISDVKMLKDIYEVLKERRDDILVKEPVNSGCQYDRWEEKLSDLDSIIEDLEGLDGITNMSKKSLKLKQIIVDIKVHQFTYGGLKRLKV